MSGVVPLLVKGVENFHFLNFDAINKNYKVIFCQALCKDHRSSEEEMRSILDVPPLLPLCFVLLEGQR